MTTIFEDDFESGDFSAWTNTNTSSGESVSVSDVNPHHGIYSLLATSNGGDGYEYASVYRNFGGLSEVYARFYLYIDTNGIADDADRFSAIILSGTSPVLYAGWKRVSGTLRWWLMMRNGTSYVESYSTTTSRNTGEWYCVEIYWKNHATEGEGRLYVNGNLETSLTNRDTDNYGNCTRISVGIAEAYNCGSHAVYVDCAIVADAYIGLEGNDLEVDNLTVNNILTIGADTNLYSSAPDILETADSLIVDGNLGVGVTAGRKLDVNGFSRFRDVLFFGADESWGRITWDAGKLQIKAGSGKALTLGSDDVADKAILNTSGQLQLPAQGSSGGLVTGSGASIEHNASHITISDLRLPTESLQYKTYTDLGHGNVLFKHTGSADPQHQYPPSDTGRYASFYLVMVQDPGDSIVYQPIIATDRGLWVEKDIQAYGALFTSSDPGKGTSGGAVLIGHGFYGNQNFPPCIVMPDAGFSTLHLFTSVVNQTHANLVLSDLTVHGGIIIGNYGSISSAGDAIFNSVLGTAATGLKVGPIGTTYMSVSRVGNTGYLTSHYGDLRLASLGTIWFESAASPTGAGTKNLGSASAYWNEVNAKSFPDRGCPIWIEPHEAREILKGIKPHPTLKSANKFKGKEVPQFDYSSLPEILKPNEGDGIRIEALLYTVYHVVRDLIERVETLEMKTA